MLKVHTYAKCETCRKAVKFLRAHGVPFEEIPIRETPPTKSALRAMLAAHGGAIRKLFNTSGADYKALGLGAKLPDLPEEEAIDLLAAKGNLVKRPFAQGGGVHLVGFDEARWREALT
ncbi:MAG: arsenate reductase family protein [Terrimicrobiaceae bacterium]|nr:arsenate reductase family protein [Terrimicrobiaceae bacterium]